MTINRSSSRIVTLFVIAILSIMLSACGGGMNLVSSAYSEDGPATAMALNMSPRIEGCDISSKQGLINAINGDTAKGGMTIGAWLDSRMGEFGCVSAAQ